MSIRTKGKVIAGTPRNGVNLFDFKWSDHLLNDASWLRADTFSWQSGKIYKSAYEHLLDDFENRTGKGTDTDGWRAETIGGTTVYYIVAPDGHKISASDQETNIQAVFESTGVAWYYIIDLENKRFKLPRTKFGFTGLRDTIGNYVAEGLPNIEGRFAADIPDNHSKAASGAFYGVAYTVSGLTQKMGTNVGQELYGYAFNANRSSSVYGGSNTVQPRATQMHLYFYVGDWIKDKELVDVGAIAEGLNAKADDSSVLHKHGEEFSTGKKGFEIIRIGDGIKNSTDAVSATEEKTFIEPPRNSNNEIDGVGIGRAVLSDGSREVRYRAGFRKRDGSANIWPGIGVGLDANDTGYVRLLNTTLPTSDSSVKVASTKFVKDVLAGNGVGLAAFNKSKNGYYKFSNGLILQWGERTGRTVTFPTPFSGSQTYTVGGTLIRNTETASGWCYVYNKTNTGFYFHVGGDSEWFNWWAIGY